MDQASNLFSCVLRGHHPSSAPFSRERKNSVPSCRPQTSLIFNTHFHRLGRNHKIILVLEDRSGASEGEILNDPEIRCLILIYGIGKFYPEDERKHFSHTSTLNLSWRKRSSEIFYRARDFPTKCRAHTNSLLILAWQSRTAGEPVINQPDLSHLNSAQYDHRASRLRKRF